MFMREVSIGGVYYAKVSGSIVRVRLDTPSSRGGWNATNLKTGRTLHIKSARRLRSAVDPNAFIEGCVPYAPAEAETPADPDRCAIAGCEEPPMMTYLGHPLCGRHWEIKSHEAASPATVADATEPTDATEAENEEIDMATKTKSKKAAKKSTKKASATRTSKTTKPAAAATPEKRMSALDAAAQVLKKAKAPMAAKSMIAAMEEQGLWTSPGGKTPHATLYAAIITEIAKKGDDSRFKKVDRGQFAAV